MQTANLCDRKGVLEPTACMAAVKAPRKMTPKQEAFALAYVETGNASEAYRRAYDAQRMKAESINVNASKLLADAKVALRVGELKATHVERHNVTVDDIAEMLREDREFARKLETPAAAVSATMGLAKLYGLITDKLNANVTEGGAKTIVYRNAG